MKHMMFLKHLGGMCYEDLSGKKIYIRTDQWNSDRDRSVSCCYISAGRIGNGDLVPIIFCIFTIIPKNKQYSI